MNDERKIPILTTRFLTLGRFFQHLRSTEGGEGSITRSIEHRDSFIGRRPNGHRPVSSAGENWEGGFGVVYVAEQKVPVRRRVALKIIKLGMDTRSVVARFEAERQALAMMDHPNIAKVFDAGATEAGRPYFVMELVRGMHITEYCDQNNLPPVQRLIFSCRFARRSSTHIRRGLFIGILSRRIFW